MDKQIRSIQIDNASNSRKYNYSLLCTKVNHACMVDGNYILSDRFRETMSHLPLPKNGYYFDWSGAYGIPGFMFGNGYRTTHESVPSYYEYESSEEQDDLAIATEKSLEEIISYVPLLRLRYSLNISTSEMRQLAIKWERATMRYLIEEHHSELIIVLPFTSTAIADSITKKAHEEGLYMSLMMLIFFILVTFFLSIQGNIHTSVGYLPLCGIISTGLSTGATSGLLALFNIPIIEPMFVLLFLVLGKFKQRIQLVILKTQALHKN